VDRIRDKFDLEGVFIDFIIKEKRKEKRKWKLEL
jgi:hypothetical protein